MRSARSPGAVEDDARIPVVFRVGVTGHRWVRRDDEDAQRAVGAALADALARRSNHSTDRTPVEGAVVSSLAEGADRLAAEWAVAHEVRLEVVLPMEAQVYAEDFATEGSRAEFRHLLDAAATVTVVPPQGTRVDAYRAAGHAVVERSDVLLAVWDGLRARGRGGTGEVVATAGRSGVPVCLLHTEQRPDGWAAYEPADVGSAAIAGLRPLPARAGPLAEEAFRALDEYNRDALRLRPGVPLGPVADPAFRELADHHDRADRMAVRARDTMLRYSRALYGLAVVAVAIAAGQLVFFHEQVWLVWFEVAALVLILAILVRARRSRLLDRWIARRVLAEHLRSGYHLAAIGASAALGTTPADVEAPEEATVWAQRAAREVLLRAEGRLQAPVGLEAGRALLLGQWIDPQLRYQRQVEEAARRREERSDRVTVVLFGVSLVAAVLHVLELFRPEGAPEYWTFLSIVVPASAAAVSGYTGHREYVRRHLRAGRMVRRLTDGRASVVRAATVPELRRSAEAIDLAMREESADWLAAIRLHELRIP